MRGIDIRRHVIRDRQRAAANTPIGHRCSNIVELIDNYDASDDEIQREHIRKSARRNAREIEELSARGNQ